MADLLDRRMMSLFGVAPTKVDKIGAQNVSKKLKKATKGLSSRSPEIIRYNETSNLGLPSIETKRGSLNINNAFNESSDDPIIKKTSIALDNNQEQRDINEEYLLAEKKLQETGKLPISIDN